MGSVALRPWGTAVSTAVSSAPAAFVRDRATWLAYVAVGLFAFLQSSLGPAMPFLRADLGFGYAVASLHFSAMALGMVATGVAGAGIARRWGRSDAFWRATAGLVVSGLLVMTSPVAAGTILGAFGIGACGALLAITIQANLAERHGARRAQAIAELNVLASACAVGASVAVGAAERAGIGWRGALFLAVVAYAGIVAGFRPVRINPMVPPGTDLGAHGRGRRGLPRAFYAYAVVISLGVSVEWCMVFWGADFLEKSAGLARADAATAMSAFFLAMVLGRFAGSRLAARVASVTLLRVALLATAAGFLVFWLAPVAALSVVGLFLTGLGTANVFPFTYAAALDAAPGQPDVASARLTVCAGGAVLVIPLILGLAAGAIGIEWAFGIVLPLLAGALGTVLVAERRTARVA